MPAGFVTTGVPAANASSTLFLMPDPELAGEDRDRGAVQLGGHARHVGGDLDAVPAPSSAHRAAGRAPAMRSEASGTSRRSRGKHLERHQPCRLDVVEVAEVAEEERHRRPLGGLRVGEVVQRDAVGDHVGGASPGDAAGRAPIRPMRWPPRAAARAS